MVKKRLQLKPIKNIFLLFCPFFSGIQFQLQEKSWVFFREIPRNLTNKSCVIVENYVLFNEKGADGYAHSKVETKLQKL